MVIINNNVTNVKFLRNGSVFNNHDAAYEALTGFTLTAEQDGTAILARYTAEDTNVKTLVGWVYKSSSAQYITIQDVEGASSDIMALLGGGITTDNTVTDQLEQLSGDKASTSADTSVEGAKRYAENLISELDGGVTAATGSYVKSVSEVDGKVSGTTEELPTVAGEVESKKVVMSVSEDKGEISVSKGTITSSDGTVVIDDVLDEQDVVGVDFTVHIDNVTLEKDANGVISVTSSALTQYVGDDDTIQISAAVEGVKTVSSPLTIEKVTTGLDADVREAYRLVGHGGNTIGDLVKIYKDSSLLSVALLHADTASNPQVLPTYDKATYTWTDISTPTEANQALCFAYENVSGNTVIAAVPVGSFINEQEFASGVTWDSANGKVKGVVDGTSEKDSQNTPVDFLTVGANGFKISGIKDEIDRQLDAIVEDLDATVGSQTVATGKHVAVEVVEENGVLTALTVTEDNIANADDLAELSAKTITNIDSANGSITVTPANAADGTQEIDLATDASKIKMSGFTATTASSLNNITTDSTVTDAFEEVQDVIDGVIDAIADLEEGSISGITVNGSGVTVTNNVAALAITSAPATGAEASPITVTTAEGGGVTLTFNTIDCGTY